MLDDMGRDLLGMWNVNNTFIEFSRLHPKRGGGLLPPPPPTHVSQSALPAYKAPRADFGHVQA